MTTIYFAQFLFWTLFSIASCLLVAAKWADDVINDDAAKKYGDLFKGKKISPNLRHAFEVILFMADRFYGKKIFSMKAIFRSSIFSLIWIFTILVFMLWTDPKYISWFSNAPFRHLILRNGIYVVFASLVIDYFSCCLTRYLIKWSLPRSNGLKLTILFVDLFLSIFLFYILFSATKFMLFHDGFLSPISSLQIWTHLSNLPILLVTLNDLTADMLQRTSDGSFRIVGGLKTEVVYAFPEGILFIASLLTSIWMWMYICAFYIYAFGIKLDAIKTISITFTKIEKKPFMCMASITIVLVAPTIFLLAVAIHFLFNFIN